MSCASVLIVLGALEMFSDECDDDQSINEAEVFKVA